MVGGQLAQQLVLGQVGVLELVHQDVLEAPGVFLADVGVFAQQPDGVQQQVVEIDGIAGSSAAPGSGRRRA